VATSPWLGVAAVATAAAFFCFQRALQVGPAVAVIALMTAATNVVSILGGLAVLGDPLGHSPALAAVHAAAFALVVAAAWRLAPVQASLQAPAALSPRASPLARR
jgi:energy-coupling factor transporter transmembrane protein EcfT